MTTTVRGDRPARKPGRRLWTPRRFGLLLIGTLAVAALPAACEDDPTTLALTSASTPGQVTDLTAAPQPNGALVLFTQVSDGTGSPASYQLRYALAPLQWGSAAVVSSGPCASVFAGTSVGASLVCPVAGLSPGTRYEFQLVSRRQEADGSVVFGELSNVASATPTGPTGTTALFIPAQSLPAGRVGQSYAATLQAQGGDGRYSWSLASGVLPGGLALDAASGRLQGTPNAAGTSTFSVRAASAGQTAIAALQLTVQTAAAGSVTPDFEESWAYGSTQVMQSNPRGWFAADDYSDRSHGSIELAGGQDPVASGGSSALKINFADRDGGGSGESMVGKNIVFPSWGNPREIWVEWHVRFGPGWTADFLRNGTNFDHKTLFYTQGSGSGRWETKFGKSHGSMEAVKVQIEVVLENLQKNAPERAFPSYAQFPPNSGTVINARQAYFNDRWHRVFAHLKIESSPGANDGAYELWIDGQKVFEQIGIDTGSTNTSGGFTGLNLGRNLNQVPTQAQSFYFGRIRVWKRDPGLR